MASATHTPAETKVVVPESVTLTLSAVEFDTLKRIVSSYTYGYSQVSEDLYTAFQSVSVDVPEGERLVIGYKNHPLLNADRLYVDERKS